MIELLGKLGAKRALSDQPSEFKGEGEGEREKLQSFIPTLPIQTPPFLKRRAPF
jgi:hypothetical protein